MDKEKELNIDQAKELLDYDPSTGIFSWKVSRSKNKAGAVAGSLSKLGYIRVRLEGKKYMAHRLAWAFTKGEFPDGSVDHKNGIKTDNRIENLRVGTHSDNNENLHTARSDSKSGSLGVDFYWNKWRAQIQVKGVKEYLGLFETKEEAEQAYLERKRQVHGFCQI